MKWGVATTERQQVTTYIPENLSTNYYSSFPQQTSQTNGIGFWFSCPNSRSVAIAQTDEAPALSFLTQKHFSSRKMQCFHWPAMWHILQTPQRIPLAIRLPRRILNLATTLHKVICNSGFNPKKCLDAASQVSPQKTGTKLVPGCRFV